MSGLRERKKAQTRAAIQRQALRLFHKQGYESTTVQQIAAAAEVSESTFFRYFPTKEAVVLWDDLDPAIVARIRAQPAAVSPVTALRSALRSTFGELSATRQRELRQRVELMLSAPPLRATLIDELAGPMRVLTELVAERTGRPANDPGVRAIAGAVIGVGLSAMFAAQQDPNADLVDLLDEAMSHLEAGLPLH
ncbi:TetR/AcrR family transcriptional regulator [Flindersiella endophytica]